MRVGGGEEELRGREAIAHVESAILLYRAESSRNPKLRYLHFIKATPFASIDCASVGGFITAI